MTLLEQFGHIDIYFFDQLLKGRIKPGMRISTPAAEGAETSSTFYAKATTSAPPTSTLMPSSAFAPSPKNSHRHFPIPTSAGEPVETMSFDDASADVVICSTVLHFARDEAHFNAMMDECWRVLKPGGLFFSRLASTIGMENQVRRIAGRRFLSPDGEERYLVDEPLLAATAKRLGGELPIH
ncbi:MAG: methyltransferase domain-containing protein [Acidobacteriota bacterium]